MNRLHVGFFVCIVVALTLSSLGGCPASDPATDAGGLAALGKPDPFAVDTDSDGLSDGAEEARGTDPADPDSDGDGLKDGREVELGTNPLVKDTDDDGLSDGDEVDLGADPLDGDSDADGLRDGDEVTKGTDPLKPDTDGDGLTDGDDVDRGTNPTLADTDSDGLIDGDEVKRGTNPVKADTDGDGLSDGSEVNGGTDPTDADSPKKAPRPKLDGDWQLLVGGRPLACVSIESDALSYWDQGCQIPGQLTLIDQELAQEIEDITQHYHDLETQRIADLRAHGLGDSSAVDTVRRDIAEKRDRAIAAARSQATADRNQVLASAPLVACEPFSFDGTAVSWRVTLVPTGGGVTISHELQLVLDGDCWSGALDYLSVTLCSGGN